MSITTFSLEITTGERKTRAERLLAYIQEQNLSGVVLYDLTYMLYYAGFAFIPTERPMAFVMNASGERALFVPRLEVEHAQSLGMIDRVEHYREYPDDPHPAEVLKTLMLDMGLSGRIGADDDGYPWILGYQGPTLTEQGFEFVRVRSFIEAELMIKSDTELALIQESCRWGNLAHMLLQKYTRVGASETEVSERASSEANRAMLDAIGPIYRSQAPFFGGASAGYRGQIRRNAAIPHALSANITFQPGDTLVTGAGAPVWGYFSELERTMFMGPPSDDQKRYFDHMVALQGTAFEAMIPGKLCSDVDKAVRAYFEKHDLMPYWKHHSGHAIGLRYHEGPVLDKGDDTELKPGMVFTVEPGLYVPGLGGFRHSDTVRITNNGIELMTYYPRDLDSLIIPV